MIPIDEYRRKIDSFIQEEKSVTNGPRAVAVYAELHRARFRKMLGICTSVVPAKNAVVLDVGRSNLTGILASYYESVWSLGFDLAEDEGGHREQAPLPDVRHIVFDLNESCRVEGWPGHPEQFDLEVVCETLEHLPTAPEFAVLMLSSMLKPGGIMLVTVPNAAAMSKRVKSLLGLNPFEKIRYNLKNPGHFREYTLRELEVIGKTCGLEVISSSHIAFSPPGRRIVRNLIPSMKEGVMLLFRKPGWTPSEAQR